MSYTKPRYMHDAPQAVVHVTTILADAAVKAMSSGLKEAYPSLDEGSLEFRQLLAAIFHRAEWLALNAKEGTR